MAVSTAADTPMKQTLMLTVVAAGALAAGLYAQGAQPTRTKSPEGAVAYIISPKNGETVTSPFTVQFGLKGMGVAPAGVNTINTGHHHLLVDLAQPPNVAQPLPVNDNVRHFGGGQTEVSLTLPAGRHTLQLLLGDALHTPHDKPVMSEKITVTVR